MWKIIEVMKLKISFDLFLSVFEYVFNSLWEVFQNIERYGGDVSNVMLMGQSAGAHLAAMLLLEHGLLEAKHVAENRDFNDNWSVKDPFSFQMQLYANIFNSILYAFFQVVCGVLSFLDCVARI